MTSKVDFIKSFLDQAWANPPSSNEEAGMNSYSDDFQYLDIDGNVVTDKAGYIGMGQMMFGSFDDFHWVLKELREEGGGVIMTGHFEGTHTGDLDLSAMGAGVFPASGKKVVWPEASVKFEVSGDKINSVAEYGGEGGLEAFLAAVRAASP
jgi:predicted ester cyclase